MKGVDGACGTKNGHFMLSTLSFEECKAIKQRFRVSNEKCELCSNMQLFL